MILKIIDEEGNQYIYSDICEVTVGIMTQEELDKDTYNKSYIVSKNSKKGNFTRMFRLFKNDTLYQRIVVDSFVKVYLMNDEGKTIERLN